MNGIDNLVQVAKTHETKERAPLVAKLKIGQAARQGDVVIMRVPLNHPRGKLAGTYKLALGTTMGASHFAEGSNVTVFEPADTEKCIPKGVKFAEWLGNPRQFIGRLVVAGGGGKWRLTHLEHSHYLVEPEEAVDVACYQVIHQADPATRRRVED